MILRFLPVLGLLIVTTLLAPGQTIGKATDKAAGPLKPGEFYWQPHLSPRGPVVMVVSLPQQMMVVYRNGIQIGRSSISSGAGKKATPTGVYEILQKRQEHYSNIYNNAPMPYMQRLTWSGIALHAGQLPGYPASKGCIRLPYDFSRNLFEVTKLGGVVVITDEKKPTVQSADAPGRGLTAHNQSPEMLQQLSRLDYVWNPEKSPKGPVAVLVSSADRQLYVYRNGVLIARGAFQLKRPSRGDLGEHVFTLLEGSTSKPNPLVPGRYVRRWMEVGPKDDGVIVTMADLVDRVLIAPDFAAKLYDLIVPGTTFIVTDEPALRDSKLNIITTD